MYYLVHFENDVPVLEGLRIVGNVYTLTIVELVEPALTNFDYVKYQARPLTEQDVLLGFPAVGNVRGYIKTSFVDGEKIKSEVTPEMEALALNLMKVGSTMLVQSVISKRYAAIDAEYNDLEKSTWAQQRAEATAYTADNTSPTPLLSVLAEQRGITVAELAAKVLAKVAEYNQRVTALVSLQQGLVSQIGACATIRDMNRLNEQLFGFHMPLQQAKEEGLVDENGLRNPPVSTSYTF